MFRNAQGQREIDGRPEVIKQQLRRQPLAPADRCDRSLLPAPLGQAPADRRQRRRARRPGEGRQGQDHRPFSEVSAATLRRAHAVHPIAARADGILAVDAQRRSRGARHLSRAGHRLRRVQPARARLPHRRAARFRRCRRRTFGSACRASRPSTFRRTCHCSTASPPSLASKAARWRKLALAWVLAQGAAHRPDSRDHASRSPRGERRAPTTCALAPARSRRLNELINPSTVSGARYNPMVQQEIDTEEIRT